MKGNTQTAGQTTTDRVLDSKEFSHASFYSFEIREGS
jgi:hypothetical protein